jgi:hypothetical protein
VTGSITGLDENNARPLTLQNNLADDLVLTSNGTFTFTASLRAGETYSVTVKEQPLGYECEVSNGAGTINQQVTNVLVTCAPGQWSAWPIPPDCPAAEDYALTVEVVTDKHTGLMWQRQAAAGTPDWQGADTTCKALVLGGFSDWRVPSLIELKSIVNFCTSSPDPSIDLGAFPSTASDRFWSSTSPYNDATYRLMVNFKDGHDTQGSVVGLVRCVR